MIQPITIGLDRVFGGYAVAGVSTAGGPNRTTITTKDHSIHSERTDYGYCADIVRKECLVANSGWWTDRKAAAQCVLERLPTCPPGTVRGPRH